jgi:truncated hemoglobin YjbI
MRSREAALFALVVVMGALAGCATMEPPPTLYERLTAVDFLPGGAQRIVAGRDAIALVVDDFVANMVANPTTKDRFNFKESPKTKALIAKGLPPALAGLQVVSTFKAHLADQICEATGGPCSYLGRDMKATHAGMKITDAEWSATVEALVKALDRRKVAAKEKGELIGLLGSLKGDIVGQ